MSTCPAARDHGFYPVCSACGFIDRPTPQHASLMLYLEAAVPLWAHRLSAEDPDLLIVLARRAQEVIAHQTDCLERGGTRGVVARSFNSIAMALGIMSMWSGGVWFGGCYWRHHHQWAALGEAPRRAAEVPP